jgi:hypothetical protein
MKNNSNTAREYWREGDEEGGKEEERAPETASGH